MSDDTRRVLDLLAQGKITVDEADRLLRAMAAPPRAEAAANPAPRRGRGGSASPSTRTGRGATATRERQHPRADRHRQRRHAAGRADSRRLPASRSRRGCASAASTSTSRSSTPRRSRGAEGARRHQHRHRLRQGAGADYLRVAGVSRRPDRGRRRPVPHTATFRAARRGRRPFGSTAGRSDNDA